MPLNLSQNSALLSQESLFGIAVHPDRPIPKRVPIFSAATACVLRTSAKPGPSNQNRKVVKKA